MVFKVDALTLAGVGKGWALTASEGLPSGCYRSTVICQPGVLSPLGDADHPIAGLFAAMHGSLDF
jgi:hypothetical protein